MIDKARLPKQIRDKFKLENDTLKRVVKASPERKIEIEIGDAKQPDFKPQVKTSWFNNEYNRSIRAEEHPGAVVKFRGEEIIYERPDGINVIQYDKPDAGEEGGHELEWELLQKPIFKGDFFRLNFSLRYKGNVKFYYQPALTPEEIEQGVERPENVVGSYAVYIDKSNHKVGGNNYATGKIEHIYRPKAIDADGNEAWCTLYIPEDGQAETDIQGYVDVPREFLDKAVYPVLVDPTIGYTTIGGTQTITTADRVRSTVDVASEDGDITSMSVYSRTDSIGQTCPYQLGVYDTTLYLLGTPSSTDNFTSSIASWRSVDVSASFKSGQTIYLSKLYDKPASYNGARLYYDQVALHTTPSQTTGVTFPTWPEPVSTTNSQNARMSIYATYTAAPTNPEVDSSSYSDPADSGDTSLTWSHTVSGTNRYLMVGVTFKQTSSDTNVTSVTYNGDPLTKIRSDEYSSSSMQTELWGMVAPDTGTHDIVVTIGAGQSAGSPAFLAGATSFVNVHQEHPINNHKGNSGNTAPPIVEDIYTLSPNSMVVDVVGLNYYTGGMAPNTVGQTKQYNQPWGLNGEIASSTKLFASADETDMGWDNVISGGEWAISAAVLRSANEAVSEETKTHTTDVFNRTADMQTHNSDVFKRDVNTLTHSSDVVLHKELTKTHTTDVFNLSGESVSHSTDIVNKTQPSKTHTTDVYTRSTSELTVSHTTDTYKRSSQTKSHTSDVYLRTASEQTKTHTTDVFKRSGLTKAHTSDVYQRDESTKVHTTDTFKRTNQTKTHTTDVYLHAGEGGETTQTKTHTTDVYLYYEESGTERFGEWSDTWEWSNSRFFVQHDTDVILSKRHTITHTTDTHKANRSTKTHTTDVVKKSRNTTTFTSDVTIGNDYYGDWSETWSWDAVENFKNHTTDVVVKSRTTKTHTTDVFKRAGKTTSHTSDVIRRDALTTSHTTDVHIATPTVERTKTHTTDVYKRDELSKTHTTDTFKRDVTTLTHTTDVYLQTESSGPTEETVTHTTDVFARSEGTTSHTTDVFLLGEHTIVHTTDVIKRKERSVSHSTDLVVKNIGTVSHTTDVRLRRTPTLTHTTDVYKRAEQTVFHTTDIIRRKEYTTSHTTDVYKRAEIVLTHTTDVSMYASREPKISPEFDVIIPTLGNLGGIENNHPDTYTIIQEKPKIGF